MEKQEIQRQAKKIMDDFVRALDKSKVKEETVFVERKQDRREARDEKADNDFREIMLKNAPETKDDFIIAEKGEWEE